MSKVICFFDFHTQRMSSSFSLMQQRNNAVVVLMISGSTDPRRHFYDTTQSCWVQCCGKSSRFVVCVSQDRPGGSRPFCSCFCCFQTKMQYFTAFIIIKMQRSLFQYLKIHVKPDVVPSVVVCLCLSFHLPFIHALVRWVANIKISTDNGCQWRLYTLASNLTPQKNCKSP